MLFHLGMQYSASYDLLERNLRAGRYHADVDSTFWGWNRIWLDPEFRSWNIEALLPSIRCPVLAIQGEDDEYGTMAQIELKFDAPPSAVRRRARVGGERVVK